MLYIHQHRFNYKIITKETIDEIRNIIPSIHEVREKKNKFAHYCWSRVDDYTVFGAKLSGKPIKVNVKDNSSTEINTAELNSLYTKSYNLVENIEQISIEHELVYIILKHKYGSNK